MPVQETIACRRSNERTLQRDVLRDVMLSAGDPLIAASAENVALRVQPKPRTRPENRQPRFQLSQALVVRKA